MKVIFTPIGIVQNKITKRHAMSPDGVESQIHIDERCRHALYRIGQEKYLWILSFLHQAKRNVLVAKPRKSKCLTRGARGVFSIHSPDRPNPIALTKVKLISRRGLVLKVSGLDVINGTPILDIKGATRFYTKNLK